MKELFHHAYKVLEKDGVYTPARFTPRQIEIAEAMIPAFGTRARYSTGVSLKFYTDAEEISFAFSAKVGYTRVGGFDVYENDVLYLNIPTPDHDFADTFRYRKETPGRVLIEIYFPSNAQMSIWDIDFGNWEAVKPEEKLVLFYGDSLTQSAYSPEPSFTFVALSARMAGVDYVNRGIGQMFFEEAVLDEEDPLKPWMIVVELGPNDMVRHTPTGQVLKVDGKDVQCTVEDVPHLLQKARAYLEKMIRIYPQAKIVVMTMLHNFLENTPSDLETELLYTQGILEICQSLSVKTVDGCALLPHVMSCHVADKIHLSSLGGAHIAIGLAPFIREEMQ